MEKMSFSGRKRKKIISLFIVALTFIVIPVFNQTAVGAITIYETSLMEPNDAAVTTLGATVQPYINVKITADDVNLTWQVEVNPLTQGSPEDGPFIVTGNNFGIIDFYLNFQSAVKTALNVNNFTLQPGWDVDLSQQPNQFAGDGLGIYNTRIDDGPREDPLLFEINFANAGVTTVDPRSLLAENNLGLEMTAHVGGFSDLANTTIDLPPGSYSLWATDNPNRRNTTENIIGDATSLVGGEGPVTEVLVSPYGELKRTEVWTITTQVSPSETVTSIQLIKTPLQLDSIPTYNPAVNALGLTATFTSSARQILQTTANTLSDSQINDLIGFKIEKINRMTNQVVASQDLVYGESNDWVYYFGNTAEVYFATTESFLQDNPAFGEIGFNYVITIDLKNLANTFYTTDKNDILYDNPNDQTGYVQSVDLFAVDPGESVQMAPELPPAFFGLFSLLMAGLILKLKRRILAV